MTTNLLNLPEDVFNANTIGLLLKKIDHDLALNIIMSGVSLNTQKIIEVVQACVLVSTQREQESREKIAAKAEAIVEKVMSEFDPTKTIQRKPLAEE